MVTGDGWIKILDFGLATLAERGLLSDADDTRTETAEALSVSEDVVKTRLSRGRAALRRLLLDRTGATAPEAFRFYRPRCDRVVDPVLARIVDARP
jgi:hypothetical protein